MLSEVQRQAAIHANKQASKQASDTIDINQSEKQTTKTTANHTTTARYTADGAAFLSEALALEAHLGEERGEDAEDSGGSSLAVCIDGGPLWLDAQVGIGISDGSKLGPTGLWVGALGGSASAVLPTSTALEEAAATVGNGSGGLLSRWNSNRIWTGTCGVSRTMSWCSSVMYSIRERRRHIR